jgi:NADH-quinone oxidoreductase subunit D
VGRCQQFLDYLKPRIDEYHTLLTRNAIFVQRTANLGILPKAMAIAYGCTGPMLRGSLDRSAGDPDWDLRRLEPYCGYEQYDFEVIIPPFPEKPPEAVLGDCWHRFYVRMREVIESIKICEQGLKKYATAAGSHRIEPPRHLPPGETYVETECPRGQMGFYVVGRNTKDPVPLRVRARSSSFANLSVTNPICAGNLIADIPAIVGSIDIVMGEVDR